LRDENLGQCFVVLDCTRELSTVGLKHACKTGALLLQGGVVTPFRLQGAPPMAEWESSGLTMPAKLFHLKLCPCVQYQLPTMGLLGLFYFLQSEPHIHFIPLPLRDQ
jgi:hypothetical protein